LSKVIVITSPLGDCKSNLSEVWC